MSKSLRQRVLDFIDNSPFVDMAWTNHSVKDTYVLFAGADEERPQNDVYYCTNLAVQLWASSDTTQDTAVRVLELVEAARELGRLECNTPLFQEPHSTAKRLYQAIKQEILDEVQALEGYCDVLSDQLNPPGDSL